MLSITAQEKFLRLLDSLPLAFVRTQYIKKVLFEKARITEGIKYFTSEGFDEVNVSETAHVTQDGIQVIRAFGRTWAMKPEIHKRKLAEAFETAQKQKQEEKEEPRDIGGSEILSVFACPKCGDLLQRTNVCPKCSIGRLGYKYKYTCACGKTEFISKEKL